VNAHPICCAGMLTQHKVQLDLREKNPAIVRPPANPYVVRSPPWSVFLAAGALQLTLL